MQEKKEIYTDKSTKTYHYNYAPTTKLILKNIRATSILFEATLQVISHEVLLAYI